MQTLLAIECSSHVNAVACIPDTANPDHWVGEISRDGIKASIWMLPAVERVLAKAHVRKTDVKVVAFGAGPGSFTGVRAACATAQALAYAWRASLIAVDCLEALAHASRLERVDVALDARMNEVYVASFARASSGAMNRLCKTTLMGINAATANNQAAVVLGSGAHLVSAVGSSHTLAAENHWAYGVACVAIAKYARGEVTDPQHAEPIYVRNDVAQTEAQRAARVVARVQA